MKASTGDTIRIYGYTGMFTVTRIVGARVYVARHSQPKLPAESLNGKELFYTVDSSVVEVNGEAFPLNSCPISEPATDYPHVPQFDYSDGPSRNAAWAIKEWEKHQSTRDCLA